MKAVDETPMTAQNRAPVKACIRLQREAGLAIVDAVTLHKSEVTKEAADSASRPNVRKQAQPSTFPSPKSLVGCFSK
jgi:hypothetical protein